MPLILPVISRPLMRVRPRLFSTSRMPRHRAYPHAPNRGSPRPNILFSLHTHIHAHVYTSFASFFFIYIYIYTHTIRRKERGERTRTFARGASERRAHARRVGRSERERGGSRRAAARNISTFIVAVLPSSNPEMPP